MSEHLDQDGLADVLADEPAAGALAHLEECALCAAALTELRDSLGLVSAALATLPEPVLPEGLTERLDSALAKERRARSAGTAADVVPLRAPASRRRLPGLLPMAGGLAAAAVLVVGGLLLVNNSGGNGKQSSTSAGMNAKSLRAGIATSNSGRAYAKGGAGLEALLPTLLRGEAGRGTVTAPQSSTEADTSKAAGGAAVDPLAALRTNDGLAQCLLSLSDPADPGVPLALDYGSYDSKPALVVVLPAPVKDKVYVYFVGPECNAKDSHVLFFDKVPKP